MSIVKDVYSSVASFINEFSKEKCRIECAGLGGSEQAYLISKINMELKAPVLVILDTGINGERFVEDLKFFAKNIAGRVLWFPDYSIMPVKTVSYNNEIEAARIRTLFQLSQNAESPIVVATVYSIMKRLVPRQELTNFAELVIPGEDIDLNVLIEKMISGGYERTGIVEEPGDFCMRGGIIDIFSPLYKDPLRIELFGDTVESINFFSALTQRKIKPINEAIIIPSRETILLNGSITQIVARIREQAAVLEIPVTKTREIIEQISKEKTLPGIENLIPLIYEKQDTLLDYLPENMVSVQIEPEKLNEAAYNCEVLAQKNYSIACEEKRLCIEPSKLYANWDVIRGNLNNGKSLFFNPFKVLKPEDENSQNLTSYEFKVEDNAGLIQNLKKSRGRENSLKPLARWLEEHKQAGYAILIVCGSHTQAKRLNSLLLIYNIETSMIPDLSGNHPEKETVNIMTGQASSGFVWQDQALAVVTEDEIFGKRFIKSRAEKPQIRSDLINIEDLKQDDLVVHAEHGIGRYKMLTKLKIERSTNDYILIEYKDNDKLYLPVERMSLIQKYMGVDGFTPILDKLGGSSWERVKARVKKSAEKIAGELLRLYAERKAKTGFAFENIDELYRDFEAAFPYEETEDQTKAIEGVLQDMTESAPMDRLVCGDVGYGKTEVGLRASFVAVHNGKQVAVLVPTTVLAEQHFSTFKSRFEPYPVNIACLSRFRSSREQQRIINDLKTGKTDIVIGTHRLLQKDVGFKELGLFIIDEEQRFGVKHKEILKKIRTTVDVLALTATPIPRTLHMSLLGIRDISLISTPPEYRRPIITYISEFNDSIIKEAIRKEAGRNGQIFFVHNNIHNIQRIANKIKELVPEIRMEIAHGQMKENELEKVMFKFVNKEIDLLLCTTIIESGLDIPSANTIIVNRADRFGLAQMYQLRGRVGRADEQAYAYLFIPKESMLGKDAKKRLKVLMEHSDLGSGFQIAMSDLKIRGGGTILGASQSGHIASVGYDMFLRLMEESISEIKGEPVEAPLAPEINISMSAFIPESYILDIDQRLSAYRRLAKMKELKEISDFKAELTDRFGKLPIEAANLLVKIMLKALSEKAGVRKLDLNGNLLLLSFSNAHQKKPFGIVEIVMADKKRFQITPDETLTAKLYAKSINGILAETKNILQEISRRVNPQNEIM